MPWPVLTNLDLHPPTPVRARPEIGEWGPRSVPTTRAKKALRLVVPLLGLAVAGTIFWLGHRVFQVIAQAVGL
jgi:hypothetical protein